jgi:hypothetical protein
LWSGSRYRPWVQNPAMQKKNLINNSTFQWVLIALKIHSKLFSLACQTFYNHAVYLFHPIPYLLTQSPYTYHTTLQPDYVSYYSPNAPNDLSPLCLHMGSFFSTLYLAITSYLLLIP